MPERLGLRAVVAVGARHRFGKMFHGSAQATFELVMVIRAENITLVVCLGSAQSLLALELVRKHVQRRPRRCYRLRRRGKSTRVYAKSQRDSHPFSSMKDWILASWARGRGWNTPKPLALSASCGGLLSLSKTSRSRRFCSARGLRSVDRSSTIIADEACASKPIRKERASRKNPDTRSVASACGWEQQAFSRV